MTKKITQFKMEKRPAKVGERIVITDAYMSGGYYRNGNILRVEQVQAAVIKAEKTARWIAHEEYEVITVETSEIGGDKMNVGIIEKMQAEIDDLKAKVGALETVLAKDTIAKKAAPKIRLKTAQEIRDEIVAKAKRDVEELGGEVEHMGTVYYVDNYGCYAEYIVNSDKRTVVVLLRGYSSNTVRAKGIAKCAPNDCFNVHIGKAIALRRALGLTVPSEYLQAPQPTEVRAGDIIRWDDATDSIFKIADKVENRYDFEVVRTNLPETSGYRTGLLLYEKGLYATIIDDSRANAEQKVTQ